MYPTSRRAAVLPADRVERELLAPNGRLRPLVDILDVRRKDACFHVCAPSCEEDIVRMPINGENGRADGLLELLGDPPIAFGIERTDCDRAKKCISVLIYSTKSEWAAPSTACDCKLVPRSGSI